MSRRLFFARLWFEGNRFAARTSTRADFERREWWRGTAALARYAGTASEMGALAQFAAEAPEWSVGVSRCASANPGGPIEEALFAEFLAEVLEDLALQRPDAVYLSLHGAAITTARDRPELELLRAVRGCIGARVPLGASFDLHANLAPAVVEPLDTASAYRTYPHLDMRETAARVIGRVVAMAAGRSRSPSHGFVAPTGLLLPSLGMRSDRAPMRTLLERARALEQQPGIVDVSVFGGFPYADTADAGASVMAWADTPAAAERCARQLAAEMSALAPDFEPVLRTPRAALREAAALGRAALVAVTDPADNPLSGGAADTPGLFEALLAERRDPDSPLHAWPAGRIVFAYFADAPAVQAARSAGVGAWIELALGARHSAAYGKPVAVRARVLRLTEGRFVNSGPMERGLEVQMGASAVLEIEGIEVVLGEQVVAANDPGFFALHGIDLRAPLLLVVKAKNHFRAAFGPLCACIVDAEAPGPAANDLSSLPLQRARDRRRAVDPSAAAGLAGTPAAIAPSPPNS